MLRGLKKYLKEEYLLIDLNNLHDITLQQSHNVAKIKVDRVSAMMDYLVQASLRSLQAGCHSEMNRKMKKMLQYFLKK